jgi:alpha/beta superfamily hydrolase
MRLSLDGPSGPLEAELWLPERDGQQVPEPRAACAFCHPHPLYGGTMKSSIVFRAARGLQAAGVAVLRFNFRGVGRSAGVHDGAGAEEADLAAALDHLAERLPSAELWAGGFSFGARMAAGLALRDARIRRLVLVALPVRRFDPAPLRALATPGLLLLADEDAFGRPADVRALLPELEQRMELDSIPGADHFFRDYTRELEARVRSWARRQLPTP